MDSNQITSPFSANCPDDCCSDIRPKIPHPLYRFRHLIALCLLVGVIGLVLYQKGSAIMQVLENRSALEAFVQSLGVWGPLALIASNVLQIVVAPIPGYAVYLVAGYLFGPLMGGIWGSIGMLVGALVAMLIGRKLGRPIVQSIIGEETLSRWEDVTRSDSTLVWGAILLSPIGDAPFLLAGLSRVSFSKILVLTVITRIPAAFVAAAVGSGVLHLSLGQIGLLVTALAIPLVILYRYQDRLLQHVEKFIQNRTAADPQTQETS